MKKGFFAHDAVPALCILAIIALLFTLPFLMRKAAAQGSFAVTESGWNDLPNYDIRNDKAAYAKLEAFRATAGRSASAVSDIRDTTARGVESLERRIPGLKIEYNDNIRIPEVIAPDIASGKNYLTQTSTQKRSDILKQFLSENSQVVGALPTQIDELKVAAEYTNPDGGLSFVGLNQEIRGIPVFRGEVKAGFTRSGRLIRVINNLAPGVGASSVSADFGDPAEAVQAAASHVSVPTPTFEADPLMSTSLKFVFGRGDSATTAEKIYFPTEPGVIVPAWRILLWQPVNAYYVIVDAANGTLLWRKNITDDQTQPATYSVYANPGAMINVARDPFPFSPGPVLPNGAQGTAIARTSVTRIGNEGPYSFNQLGWITDGGTRTDGNAVQAGLDRDATDGIDPNSEAMSAAREFVFSYDPLDPNTNTGDDPVPISQTYPGSPYQQGAVTQLFYICNWFHDETYRLGFTEAARNFQNVNFTGQGVAGDRVRAEGQDSIGLNGANFATPADGSRGRMQIFLWTGPNPDLDGSLDASVVIHEHTHGMSQRLHGNGMGLVNDMSRGLGEGWSDFYALSMLSQASDPPGGVYTIGAYDSYRQNGTFLDNSYYGVRRFPTVIRSSVGGPGNRPHNPLTFADIDATQIDISDGAFPFHLTGGNSDAVHNAGEIWASILWEIRARFIARLGWEVGNRRMLQFVTDGMKLAPLSPTFLHERDAMIAAALASGTAEDVADMWAGFAVRGLGASASIENVGGTSIGGTGTARVTEAFDLPNLIQSPAMTVTDPLGNGNGYADPGEVVTLSIPLTNNTGDLATGVSLQIAGGGSADYGTIASGVTKSRVVTYVMPFGFSCGDLTTLTLNVNSSLGQAIFVRSFPIGAPTVPDTHNFDSVTPPAIPAGWSVTSSYAPMTFVSTAAAPDTPPNSMFAADLPSCTSGCPTNDGGSTELTSPVFQPLGTAASVTFRHKYNTETGFDGGVLEIKIDNGAFQDIVAAGGTFLQNGYNAQLGVSNPNPLGGRIAWTGSSDGYITTVARLPATARSHIVQLRWRFGADNNNAPPGGGWHVDSIQILRSYLCFASFPRTRSDFDGDGKTDVSIYRPAEGKWYINRSDQGFTGVSFGLSVDIPTPGDFDDDGKTDVAVWRPTDGNWYRINSLNGSSFRFQFGQAGDVPQQGDFDGDGRDDVAVFRPSNGTWYWQNSSNGEFGGAQFGQSGDLPVAGDWDGDRRDDLAVWRPSNGLWYRLSSGDGQVIVSAFGQNGDMPVNADYDGDGRQDLAVFRPSDGVWYWQDSSSGEYRGVQWGLSGDVPVPGDYDGDGRYDHGVFRNGVWYVIRSSGGFQGATWGFSTDIPIPKKYIP